MKDHLRGLLTEALSALRADGALPSDLVLPVLAIERTKSREHGDYASNIAMGLAKPARSNPRALAQKLLDAMPASANVLRVEIAGPGFINFFLSDDAWRRELVEILRRGNAYGCSTVGNGQRVGVEYVSANPTGPLHVGHGRAAAIGDTLARLLAATGWEVVREFYYNDGGVQIENLARSVQARCLGVGPDETGWPVDGYRGDYIIEIARAYLDGARLDGAHLDGARVLDGATVQSETETVVANGDPQDLDTIRRFAVAWLRHEQNDDLAAFGVRFDVYFLESSLYTGGMVEQTVRELTAHGHTYEEGGALWLRTTDYGDDKDRVMRKSDGSYTYFVPDVAYHLSKWERGYTRAITELGADHHGSLARVRAGLQALERGIPKGWPEYVLHQMVTVMRGNEEVKLSKRAGSYLTLRDLIEEAGRDATRYFLIARKSDSQLVFDIDLAREQSSNNPVYYIQYAHARVCSLLRQASERGTPYDQAHGLAQLARLTDAADQSLMIELTRYPEVLDSAAAQLEPHALAQYLRDLAYAFHAWYHAVPVLIAEDPALRDARLALASAARQVIANGLELLGLSAPEVM